MKFRLPESARNWVSLTGAMIATISFFMIVFLFTLVLMLDQESSYVGLVIYIILPGFLVLGLLLIPIGMISYRKKIRKSGEDWPKVDLNDTRHRNAFFIFVVGTTIFLFLSAIGSYQAFHYTESVEFCGTTCHNIMIPEHTAYQNSPHARVACVDCHVGSGADWYMRSKLSGLYQVYATIVDNYPRPIPTPIKNLRPAQDTCEKCHWPEKFYPQTLRVQRHYLNDEENTSWDIYLNMKIGGAFSELGLAEGIHWHINPDVDISYYSSDEKNLSIPWVKYTNKKTGKSVIYQSEDNPLEESEIDPNLLHTMDCMDCHNRPSHSYRPPALFVNAAMTTGEIPADLPEIKSLAMEICGMDFSTTDSAFLYIEETVREFYESDYPEIIEENPEIVNKAVTGLQSAFSKNIFPEMKVRWDAYPNHIGHLEFNGCFRCHDDQHVSASGSKISKDCNQCHGILAQGEKDEMELASIGSSLEFRHPVDIDGAWQEGLCTECHTGLNP